MELRHLRYLIAVAETGSVTRAAERLHVSQPTLSQQLRQLEDQVGATLFDRLPRGLRPTQAGLALVARAQRALREVAAAGEDIAALNGLTRGELKLGVIHSFCAALMPQAVARFHAAHPGVRVQVSDDTARGIAAGVAEGRLDLGIAFAPAEGGEIATEVLFAEELVLMARPGHELVGRGRLKVRDLAGVRLALQSRRFATRRLTERAFAEAGLVPEVAVEIDPVGPLIATVAASDLVTIMSPHAIPPGLVVARRGLTGPTPLRQAALLTRRDGHLPPAAAAFAALFRAVAASQAAARARSSTKRAR